jgi:hypothetical protein
MQLEGRVTVGREVLRGMYLELGTRRIIDANRGVFGAALKVDQIVDFKFAVDRA